MSDREGVYWCSLVLWVSAAINGHWCALDPSSAPLGRFPSCNLPEPRFCSFAPLPSGELQGSALVRLSLQTLATFDWGDINLLEFMRDYIMG